MENAFSVIYQVFGAVMAAYGLYFGAISVCALLKRRHVPREGRPMRFAVLAAARNEESCIAGLVESIRRQDYPPELVDIYVIPNNCTDNTAQAAQAAGAQIIRVSSSVRSKGQALHEAFEYLLKSENHDAYCVFDADNEADPAFLTEMSRALTASRAAKSRILAKNVRESWVCACYDAYFCNANVFLNQARRNLKLSARLIGTGFAVRRDLMEELGGWNTSTLTEDAEFYAMLAARGEQIAYVPDAVTYDEEPLTFRDSLLQRRRWMSGVMKVGRLKAAALLRGAVIGPNRRFALDAFLQFSFSCVQALAIPLFLLRAFLHPLDAAAALPGLALRFYLSTLSVGLAALILDRRLTVHTAKGLPLYPLFVFSFLPLQTLALFWPNRTWAPIRHTGVRLYRMGSQFE